ncbi:MAG TPA: hypothetical protein PKA63_00520 [Oligoflexia bacterium]|nr:hypothetical protein [Oligoflexia bacterium]HMP47133.1 hypothetical protein [Oligoflexia bacterium]
MLIRYFDSIALFFARTLVFILEKLPTSLGNRLAYLLVRLFLLSMPRHRSVALRNLEIIFPDKSREEHLNILEKSYKVLARNIMGFVQGPYYEKGDVIKALDVEDALPAINAVINNPGPSGTLVLVPHFGSFELLPHFWALYHRPLSVLARGFGLPKLDKWWDARRGSHGSKIFYRKGGYKSIISELNNGQNVAILFDQNIKKNHAIFVDFFGVPAATSKSIGLAPMRTNSPIVFAAIVETSPEKFKLYVIPLKKPSERPGSVDEKIYHTIREANTYLEKIIKDHPEHWFWIHRRFKTRPPGEIEDFYD